MTPYSLASRRRAGLSGHWGTHASPDSTRRMVVGGLVLLNILVMSVCALLLLSSRRADIADARLEALNDARLTEKAASGMFDKATIALGAVALQVERLLQAGSTPPDLSTLWSIEDAQVGQVAQIQRIGVFDDRGVQLCGPPMDRCPQVNVADRDYFLHLREHPQEPTKLYGPYGSRLDGQQAMVLARALHHADGGFAGVAIAVLPVERFRSIVTTSRTTPGGTFSLRTAMLELLLRQPELQGPDAAAVGRRVSDRLRAEMQREPAEGVIHAVTPSDGIERVAAYRRLEGYPLYVLAGRSTDDFLAGWRRQAILTAAFLLLFAAVSWQLARQASTSLRRQARALRLYDEAPCGYHTLAPDGRYLSVNATELAWLGCTRDEVVGKLHPADFFDADGRATFAANFPKLARGGRLEGLELDLVGRHGQVRRVLVNAAAVYDAHGKFMHSNSVLHDITALHDARQKGHALARQQGVMLDNDLVGIAKLVNRRIVWANQGMDRIFGCSGGEWADMPAWTLYPDQETYRRVGEESEAAMRQGHSYRCQVGLVRKDGSRVWIDASGSSLSAATGEVLMLLADITPLKAAEEARVRAAAIEAQNLQLRETTRLKTELVSNMSHELRTPLNAILGFGQLLASGSVKPDSPKFATYLGRIVSSGRHLLEQIEQVLDYAKVESGKMQFAPVSVIVSQALHEAVTMLDADAQARHVGVWVMVEQGLGSVTTDPARLRQMLLALVGNAIRFSREGGSVHLQASVVDDAFWEIMVSDQGIGIAEANLSRLFSPFVQLSSGSTKTHGGTGIGLALVRMLAHAQGGRVEVRSQLGEGSTFTLTLPRVLSSDAEQAERPGSHQDSRSSTEQQPS